MAGEIFHRGFHAIRMNQRNCGSTEALTPTLYNSGMSADYRAVFEERLLARIHDEETAIAVEQHLGVIFDFSEFPVQPDDGRDVQ